jgi:hypothetical protein
MVIQRSRKWIKDRLPAFICRETSWWISRWIQCNVFLCPECRKEYGSLKSVWDRLDQWRVEDPEEEVESCFIENFRQKYPGAYEEEDSRTTASGFWLPRVAYLTAIALLGVVVLWQPQVQRTAVRTVKVEASVNPSSHNPQLAEKSVTAETSSPVMKVAEAPSLDKGTPPSALVSTPQRNEAPPTLNLPPAGTRFRTTSTLDPVANRQTFRSPLPVRTIEINDMPVPGFDSLTQPYEEERPY